MEDRFYILESTIGIVDTQILEDIGLTNAEIKVYLSLLELGSASAGPIIEHSGLQSSVVHMTLNKLLTKGFISVIQEGKKHFYQASNPNHVLKYLDEKKERYQELLPQLLIKQATAKSKPEIITYRGIRGIKELLFALLEAGGTEHHTIGSAKESLMLGEGWWVSYHSKRAQKHIKAKLLFNESLKTWSTQTKYPKAEIRHTEAGFEPLTETIIRNNTVGIIIWTEKPVGILIEQPAVAASYEQYFQKLWKNTQ
jgi:HTH-type transcriptional regulator, sugar sensing transcriptional regulator